MASTGQPETGRGMDTLSTELEITDHVEAWTYKVCGTDDAAGAVVAVTKGQALVQRTTDNGSDLSGYVYPSTKESEGQFVGFAAESKAIIGADVNMQGYLITVVKHGFANYVKANGALINGDRLMTSGPSGTYLADAAGHLGTVAKYPDMVEEEHVVTKAEAAANAFDLKLVPEALSAVYDTTSGAGNKFKGIYPPSGVLIVNTAKLSAVGSKTINGFAGDFAENDHVFVQYMPSRKYIIGTCEKPVADNANTQVNLVNRGV